MVAGPHSNVKRQPLILILTPARAGGGIRRVPWGLFHGCCLTPWDPCPRLPDASRATSPTTPFVTFSLPFLLRCSLTALVIVGMAAGDGSAVRAADAVPAARPAKPASAQKTDGPYARRTDVRQWVQGVARRRGIPEAWLHAQMARARHVGSVLRLVTPPPSATAGAAPSTQTSWPQYRQKLITSDRIAAGVQFWQDNEATLARAQAQFGVPAALVVGIIGVESGYGANMGRLRVLDTLSTLAFDFPVAHPRAGERADYFRRELEQFLAHAHASDLDAAVPRGSYAGAVGLGQFMPSSQATWAVDFDGDGRVDLSHSTADAIGSVAHYLQAHGWQPGQPVGFAVAFDAAALHLAPLLVPDIVPSFTPAQMQAHGVYPQGDGLNDALLALLELRHGSQPPRYMAGTRNFYVITRYNRSSYYALAVYELGQEVAARRGISPTMVPLTALPDAVLK